MSAFLTIEQYEENLNKKKSQLNRPDFTTLKGNDNYRKSLREFQNKVKSKSAQAVTGAWIKGFNICMDLEIYSQLLSFDQIIAFFPAEFPGAMISAVNHIVKTNLGKPFSWKASSIMYDPDTVVTRPSGQSVPLTDAFDLYKNYPGNWLMGKVRVETVETYSPGDVSTTIPQHQKTEQYVKTQWVWNDGDLTKVNAPDLLELLFTKSRFDRPNFIIADGSIGIEDGGTSEENYQNQEKLNLPLFIGQYRTSVQLLQPGGILVLKTHTIFLPESKQIYLTFMRSFDKFKVIKPPGSSPLNSEIYLVGIGFHGVKDIVPLSSIRQEEELNYLNVIKFYVENQINAIDKFLKQNSDPIPPGYIDRFVEWMGKLSPEAKLNISSR